MPIIKLPDGNKIDFPNKVTGIEIAEKISKSLAKQALIISVDGELKDLTHIIEKDSSVKIITHKDSDGLDAIRHDTTHIMAMAVQDLFPGTKLAIGPAIKDGFYYDFSRLAAIKILCASATVAVKSKCTSERNIFIFSNKVIYIKKILN